MSAKKVRRFKFLREGLKSNYDGFQWTMGKWHKTECLGPCHGFNCSERIIDSIMYVQGEILAEVEVRGKKFVGNDKSTHEEMKIIRAWKWQKKDSVALSIFAAELVLKNFESVYPADDRPRKAIEAAKKYLESPTEENRKSASELAESAAWSARSAAWSARSAARSAESAARSAAWSAWSAARSARSAARSACSAVWSAWSAAWSAESAAWLADSAALDTINDWLMSRLEEMEEYE